MTIEKNSRTEICATCGKPAVTTIDGTCYCRAHSDGKQLADFKYSDAFKKSGKPDKLAKDKTEKC